MSPTGSALMAVAALLAASPVLMPFSQPPIVTAVAELWATAVGGVLAVILGVRAWRQAPLHIAGLPAIHQPPAAPPSPWPGLLMATALIAAVGSALLGLAQVLAPAVVEGPLQAWVDPTHLPGRAVAHLRQPNHLATLLLWGAVAWGVVVAQGVVSRLSAWTVMVVLMAALVLTGSRTGLLGIAVLVGWGLVDHRLGRAARLLLLASPLIAAGAGWGSSAWLQAAELPEGAAAHLASGRTGDISSSRFAIWRNAWELALQHPWSGVGWGRFNTAWTLTPFPDRPTALFDHAHNLPLHLVVELGFPLGLALSALAAVALWHAVKRAWAVDDASGPWRRGAAVMLVVVALHSLLEYPLWYAYFGWPAAAALFIALGWDRPTPRWARWKALLSLVVGSLMAGGAAWAWGDYQTIRAIYAPSRHAPGLAQRMAAGQSATWFTAHAHYAVATNVKPIPGQPWTPALHAAFEGAPGVLLDARLMMAWADALASRGDPQSLDQARHIADRLREFRSPATSSAWPTCTEPGGTHPRAYVCTPAQEAWSWRDLIRPGH